MKNKLDDHTMLQDEIVANVSFMGTLIILFVAVFTWALAVS